MTADELVRELRARLGFFVYGTSVKFKEGDIILPYQHNYSHSIPMRVVGASSRADFVSQCSLANELSPDLRAPAPFDEWPYYIRLEAAD